MNKLLGFSAAIAASAMLSACAATGGLHPDYFPPLNVTGQAAGAGAVVMDPTEKGLTTKAHPTSFTGGGTTLELPINLIVDEAAVRAFSAALEGKAVSVGSRAQAPGADYYIEPRVVSTNYEYDQLSNLGFAITPKVSLALSVKVTDRAGAVVLEKVYARKDVSGGTYVASLKPAERINRTYHEVALSLMAEAAGDLVKAHPASH